MAFRDDETRLDKRPSFVDVHPTSLVPRAVSTFQNPPTDVDPDLLWIMFELFRDIQSPYPASCVERPNLNATP